MKEIDWDLLLNKKIEAPFIPSTNKENFDKKYCEGEDNIGETTIERYELYFNSELYEGVFRNYTYVNKNYLNEYNKSLNNNNKNNFNTINYDTKNNNINDEIKYDKNTIEYESKLKLNNNVKIKQKMNNGNNNLFEKSEKKLFYRNNRQSSASSTNLNYKYKESSY